MNIRYIFIKKFTININFFYYYLYCILVYRTMTNLVKQERSIDSKSLLNIILSYILIFYS